jgi:hypothetical protein
MLNVVVPSRLRFLKLMGSNVVIPLSEFMDVTLHMLVSEILLNRKGPDIVVRAARHGLGSAFHDEYRLDVLEACAGSTLLG